MAKWTPKSKGEKRVDDALSLLGYQVQHEYQVGERLRLDAYLPALRVGIEVQGSGHSEFNGKFYSDKDAFKEAQQRDRRKKELCEEQGITLICLEYDTIMGATSPQNLLEAILKEINAANDSEEDTW